MTDICTPEKLVILAEELCRDEGKKPHCATMCYMRWVQVSLGRSSRTLQVPAIKTAQVTRSKSAPRPCSTFMTLSRNAFRMCRSPGPLSGGPRSP